MRCPACFELMTNRDEIHRVSATKHRMNLHCNNHKNCPARQSGLYYGPYMQVITEDPNPWECSNYGLIVMRGARRILLQGSTADGTSTKVPSDYNWITIVNIPFVKLSTGDDMHKQAISLTQRLTKLIAFM